MEKGFNGFNASATFNFSKYLGIKADLADHFSTGSIQAGVVTGNAGGTTKESRLNIQGGLQIKNNSKEARFKPFGHFLAGINRQSVKIDNASQNVITVYGSDKITSTGFAATFGGGLDIRVSKRIDVRAIQFNYTLNSVSAKTLATSNGLGGYTSLLSKVRIKIKLPLVSALFFINTISIRHLTNKNLQKESRSLSNSSALFL